jgi:hypothetical protein
VGDLLADGHELKGGFQGRFAEIGGEGLEDLSFVVVEQAGKPIELLEAPGQGPADAAVDRPAHRFDRNR